ncbi:MAG TPA: trypsin-like peptidase domain-containing protein [Verrucomicrobiae bacterium]|nr:trypsin-like peptidase domain-containing protein [Verrucomicrobiae bacterium]
MGASPERSVIQIESFAQQPLWDTPWRFDSVRALGGSGFVIRGKRILTNAHVVSWARQIIVRRYQDPKPYLAEIEYIGHDCDLAILKVEDPTFFDKLEPLEFGDLPAVRSPVITYGYPAGGQEISYTRGVVSRVELEPYAHIGNRQLLSVQTDAAINPGNSGGPVIQDDHVVGVAFQGTPGLENTGFFIPPPVIQHFLNDISDGHYDGFPQAGARVVALQNPAYRAFLKLPDDNAGARVDSLLQIPDTEKVLDPDDVLLQVGDFRIASDATLLYKGNRLSAALAFQFTQDGGKVPLKVWRKGAEIDLDLPVHVYTADRAGGYQYLAPPRFFVYGGMVFTPLSLDYLKSLGRGSIDANSELYYELYYHRAENPRAARPEPIVLAAVLADAVNANVAIRSRALVDKINGVRIDKLEDVIRAFENNTTQYDVIAFVPHDNIECLDHREVAKANSAILKTYGLASDRRL